MSDGIDYAAFDGQPFQHRNGNRRPGDAPGAYGPADPPAGSCEECGLEPWRDRRQHAAGCPNAPVRVVEEEAG